MISGLRKPHAIATAVAIGLSALIPGAPKAGAPVTHSNKPLPQEQEIDRQMHRLSKAIPSSLATVENLEVPGAKRWIISVPMIHTSPEILRAYEACENRIAYLDGILSYIHSHKSEIPNNSLLETTFRASRDTLSSSEKNLEREEKYIEASQEPVKKILTTLHDQFHVIKVYVDAQTPENANSFNKTFGILPRAQQLSQKSMAYQTALREIRLGNASPKNLKTMQQYETELRNISAGRQFIFNQMRLHGGIIAAEQLLWEGKIRFAGAESSILIHQSLTQAAKRRKNGKFDSTDAGSAPIDAEREQYALNHIKEENAVINYGAFHNFQKAVVKYNASAPEKFSFSAINFNGLSEGIRFVNRVNASQRLNAIENQSLKQTIDNTLKTLPASMIFELNAAGTHAELLDKLKRAGLSHAKSGKFGPQN